MQDDTVPEEYETASDDEFFEEDVLTEEEQQTLEEVLKEGGEVALERLEGASEALKNAYLRTAQNLKDAKLGEKAKEAGSVFAGRLKRASERTKENLGKFSKKTKENMEDFSEKTAESMGTLGEKTKEGWDNIAKGTKDGIGKLKDGAEDVILKIPNPEKQTAYLTGLWETILQYDVETNSNPAMDSDTPYIILLEGGDSDANAELVQSLFRQFKDMAEEAGVPYNAVQVNSKYVIENNPLASNDRLKKMLGRGMDDSGVGLICVEDVDLMYKETDRYGGPHFNNRSRLIYLEGKLLQQSSTDNYKGNWLVVCTLTRKKDLPGKLEELVHKEV